MKQQERRPMAAVLRKFAMQAGSGIYYGVRATAARGGKQVPAGAVNCAPIESGLRKIAGPL
jgi:hypothetical protein